MRTDLSAAAPTFPGEIREFPLLATGSVRLRAFERSDLSRLVEIVSDHHVADSAIDVPHPFTPVYARSWIDSHAQAWADGQSVHWAVSLPGDDRLVGYVGLRNIDAGDGRAELSFWIGSGARRRDHATEATQAALAFAFVTLKMTRVSALHLTRNVLAARVLTSIGMPAEGVLRQRVSKWDHFEDVTVRGLLRTEWLAMQRDSSTAALMSGRAPARPGASSSYNA